MKKCSLMKVAIENLKSVLPPLKTLLCLSAKIPEPPQNMNGSVPYAANAASALEELAG